MAYEILSPAKTGKRVSALDKLQAQVERVLVPFGLKDSQWKGRPGMKGDFRDSRYGYLDSNGGDWSVKVRVADHANETTLANFREADVTLLTDYAYTDEQIWRKVLAAIGRQIG